MHSQNSQIQGSHATFKFEGSRYFFVALLLVDAFALLMCFIYWQTRSGPVTVLEVLFSIGMAFLLFASMVVVPAQQSDVLVTDQAISRRFMGWTWRTVRWGDIREIQVMPYFDPALRRMIRLINIYVAGHRTTGGMGIADTLSNVDQFIEILNCRIAEHGIRVRAVEGGKLTEVDRVPFSHPPRLS